MTRRIDLGLTRTGEIIYEGLPYIQNSFTIDVRGDDFAEITISIEDLPLEAQNDLRTFFNPVRCARFIAAIDTDKTNPVTFAGPIRKFKQNDDTTITLSIGSMKSYFDGIPAVPIANRYRIMSDTDVWTITGNNPASIIANIIQETTTEVIAAEQFIQSIVLPTITTGSLSKTINLYEVPSVTSIIEDFIDSYEGVEVRFNPRYVTGGTTHIEWELVCGTLTNPHINKTLTPLEVNIDLNDGNIAFEAVYDGTDNANWVFYQSGATDASSNTWIDLQADISTPLNAEDLTYFSKDKVTSPLTQAEVDAQIAARLSMSNILLKTFSVSEFDGTHLYVSNLGRRIHYLGSKRIKNLNEIIRITTVKWSIEEPVVDLTVQPEDLRVYPKVPNRIIDTVNDEINTSINDDMWNTPNSGLPQWGGTGGGTVLPPNWGDGTGENYIENMGVISIPTTRLSWSAATATKVGDRIYYLDSPSQAFDTPNIGGTFNDVDIRYMTVNAAGQMYDSHIAVGTLPASFLANLRSQVTATSIISNAVSYGRQSEHIAFATYEVNGYFYIYMALAVRYGETYTFGGATIPQPRGIKYATSIAYAPLTASGTIAAGTWNTYAGVSLAAYPDDNFFPRNSNISKWGASNTIISFIGMYRLRDWIYTDNDNLPQYYTYLSTSNNYASFPQGAGWVSVVPPPFVNNTVTPGGGFEQECDALNSFTADDGYIYVSNDYWGDNASGGTSANGFKIYRARATSNTISGWTEIFSAMDGTTGNTSYSQWIAVKNNILLYNHYVDTSGVLSGANIGSKLVSSGFGLTEEKYNTPTNFNRNDYFPMGSTPAAAGYTPKVFNIADHVAYHQTNLTTARPFTAGNSSNMFGSKPFIQGNYIYLFRDRNRVTYTTPTYLSWIKLKG